MLALKFLSGCVSAFLGLVVPLSPAAKPKPAPNCQDSDACLVTIATPDGGSFSATGTATKGTCFCAEVEEQVVCATRDCQINLSVVFTIGGVGGSWQAGTLPCFTAAPFLGSGCGFSSECTFSVWAISTNCGDNGIPNPPTPPSATYRYKVSCAASACGGRTCN